MTEATRDPLVEEVADELRTCIARGGYSVVVFCTPREDRGSMVYVAAEPRSAEVERWRALNALSTACAAVAKLLQGVPEGELPS